MRLHLALVLFSFTVVLSACSSSASFRSGGVAAAGRENGNDVEDIYVVRSVRQARVPTTSFCDVAKIGFANANIEDQYIFRSISTRTSDGLVTDASVQTVRTAHACFGPTSDPNALNFYAEGQLGGVSFRGVGDCQNNRNYPNYPEGGLGVSRCFLDLSGLPDSYVGGRLTSNSIVSPNSLIGERTDPPGYVQSSIATVRLWKRRS
jgi:hypothetical protein